MTSIIRKSLYLVGGWRSWRTWVRWLVLALLAVVVSVLEATGAVMVLLLMGLITGTDQLDLPLVGDLDEILPGADRQEQLLMAAAIIAAFFLIRASVKIAEAYWQGRVVHTAGARLSSRLLDGYLSMPYGFHLRRNSSELIRNSHESVQVFVREVLGTFAMMVSSILIVIGILTVLLATAPLAAILALAFLGPMTYAVLWVLHPRVKRMGARSQHLSKASLKTLQQSLGGVRDIKVLGRERLFSEEYRRQRQSFARAQYLRQAAKQAPREVIETSLMLFIVAFFALTILRGGSATDTLSVLALFGYSALRLKPPLTDILSGLNALKFAAPAVDDLYADVVLIEREASRQPLAPSSHLMPFERDIRIEDVRYRYEGTETDVLHGIDLTIRVGESVGIVGPTGGGKSTLVDVLMGLIPPTAGRVLVDGVDIRTSPSAWQANLGVVSQMVFLVDDTLRRNICLGLRDDEVDDARLQAAISMSQLREFVDRLPDGLETLVGERGVRVSGGQRQRIAIARALYHQPRVLVFDEGTSALDTVTENEIVSALEALRGERTIITIAHRLTTIRGCDRIVILQHGRVTDCGSYDELLDRNRDFRTMAAAS